TAIALGILQHPRQTHPRQRRTEAEQIIGHDVGHHEQPLTLLEISRRLESIAGESCKAAAESNNYQQAPARINQHALRGPDHKKPYGEAAGHNDQRSVREHWPENLGKVAAQDVTRVGAQNCAQGYSKEVEHDGVLPNEI